MFDLIHHTPSSGSRCYTPTWGMWQLLFRDRPVPVVPFEELVRRLSNLLCSIDETAITPCYEGWDIHTELQHHVALLEWSTIAESDQKMILLAMHRARAYEGPVPELKDIMVAHSPSWEDDCNSRPDHVILTPEQARHLLRGGEPMEARVEVLTGEDTEGQVMVVAESTYWSEVADPGPIVEAEEHGHHHPALQGLVLQLFPSAWAALGGKVTSIEIAEHHQLVLR